jgi:transposase
MDKVPVRCGLDIAKHVMAIHAVNHSGNVVIQKIYIAGKGLRIFCSVTPLLYELLHDLLAALLREEDRIDSLDKRISSWVDGNEMASRLTQLDGVGPITASAVVATTGHASAFKNGRQFAAWLGLVPRQYSSGGKNKLGRITKQADRYLRMLLIRGARTVLLMSSKGRGQHSDWIESLRSRKPDNVVAVAYAAKQARMLWAVMAGKPAPLVA